MPALRFRCEEGGSFEGVREAVTGVEGFIAIGKLPQASSSNGNNSRSTCVPLDEGLIECDTEEALVKCKTIIQALPRVAIAESGKDHHDKAGAASEQQADGGEAIPATGEEKSAKAQRRGQQPQQPRRNATRSGRAGDRAAEFFAAASAPQQDHHRSGQEGQPQRRRQNNNNNNAATGSNNNGSRGRGGSRGGGRGGYVTGGRGGSGGRGGAGLPFPFPLPFVPPQPQFIQGHVATMCGVAPSTTNDQIAEAFGNCGQIYDIARYENLAMIYFDTAESVMNAICAQNGRQLRGNVVAVSDGGSLRVPIPMM